MKRHFKQFLRREEGAVTVDWVVLTAAIVGLGLAVISTVADGALNHSSSLGTYLTSQTVQTY